MLPNTITDHGLPTEPISACFIRIHVGSDPQEFFIPLTVAEAWGLSRGQSITPEKAFRLGKAVKRYRARRQAGRSGKASKSLSRWAWITSATAAIRAVFQRTKSGQSG